MLHDTMMMTTAPVNNLSNIALAWRPQVPAGDGPDSPPEAPPEDEEDEPPARRSPPPMNEDSASYTDEDLLSDELRDFENEEGFGSSSLESLPDVEVAPDPRLDGADARDALDGDGKVGESHAKQWKDAPDSRTRVIPSGPIPVPRD